MHATIGFLKRAAPKGGFYHFWGGAVFTRNEQILAVAPSPFLAADGFNLPCDEVHAVLARIEGDPDLAVGEGHVLLRGARLKAQIPTTQDTPPAIPPFSGNWQRFPVGLLDALRMAKDFVADQPGPLQGMRVTNNRVTAMSNAAAIDVVVPGLECDVGIVTPELVDFITDEPTEMAAAPGALLFRWSSGEWCRAQLINAEFPSRIDSIFDGIASQLKPVEVTSGLREALEDAAALAEGSVELTPAGFSYQRNAGSGLVDAVAGLPEDHRSLWPPKHLTKVLAIAERWNPEGDPRKFGPCAWEGPNCRGIMMRLRG